MDCREFFKINEGNTDKCKLLQDDPDRALNWEKSCSASEYSAATDRITRSDRQFFGLAPAKCENVRAIFTTAGKRAFCVFDTALADDPSHTDICQIVRGNKEGRSVRSKLYDAFNTVEQFTEKGDFQECLPLLQKGGKGVLKAETVLAEESPPNPPCQNHF